MMSMSEHFLCLIQALVYPHGQYFDLKISAKGIHYRILKSGHGLPHGPAGNKHCSQVTKSKNRRKYSISL